MGENPKTHIVLRILLQCNGNLLPDRDHENRGHERGDACNGKAPSKGPGQIRQIPGNERAHRRPDSVNEGPHPDDGSGDALFKVVPGAGSVKWENGP